VLSAYAKVLDVEEDEVIIQQGDTTGDLFYILEEGCCEILVSDSSKGFLKNGSSFGDLSLMYNCPRAATILSRSHCTLWTLNRVHFRKGFIIYIYSCSSLIQFYCNIVAIVTSASSQNGQLMQFLSKIALFEGIAAPKLSQLARSLTKQA